MVVETVFIQTIDGVEIEADIIRTDAIAPRAVVIIGHPHPLYGGDRHSHVVRALQEAASRAECHSIAIDFRGVGNSGGFHDDGDSERLDLAAACELADMIEPECPIIMSGYSFGSVVAMNVSNPWITAWLSIAPPTSLMTSSPVAANNHRPKIVVMAEHDQITTPGAIREAMREWDNVHFIDAPGVDHFFAVDALAMSTNALQCALSEM